MHLTGAARGLNPKNMILPTHASVETVQFDGDGAVETQPVRHVTRQSKHGRSDANYDMKVNVTSNEYEELHAQL